ncbi:MAG: LEA type 2 family protein, partial [Calditrichia bacterium]
MLQKSKKGLVAVSSVFLTVLIVIFCSSVKNLMKIENPRLSVSDVKITGLSFENIDLLFDIKIDNPNSIGVNLSAFEYDFLINENSFLKGREEKKFEISANGESIVQLPIGLGYSDIYDAYKTLTNEDSSTYQLNGSFSFSLPLVGDVTIPVSKSGYLPLVKLPRLSVEDLKINRFGFSGADLKLRVKVDNPNAFSMAFINVNYNFNVNGKSWVAGTIKKVIS